ncbi:MAG TPA: hypothetical protein VJ417_12445, partial [Candidatus Glassbacteria bacterium]|nr:hypothetical protein [Candidatus Glassbacteria bacterium]
MPASRFISFSGALLAAVIFCSLVQGEVIFSEDFESGSLGERWEKYSDDPARGGFEIGAGYVHSGSKS